MSRAVMDGQQQNTAGAVHQIPNDLIYSIMLKLPTKSLVRFLTLSKEWKKEITNRKFFKRRKKTSPELLVSNILVGHYDYQKKLFKVDAHRLWGSHCQHGGCAMELSSCPVRSWLFSSTSDGLLGIVHEKEDVDQVKRRIYSFVIWNPYTGQKKEVSLPLPKGRYKYENGACSVVFGYDSTIDDYKIVIIFLDNNSISLNNFGEVVGIMIGALRSDELRIMYCASSNSSDLERFSKHDALAVDGDVWWIAKRGLGKSQSSNVLMKLCLSEEKLSTVSWPPGLEGSCWTEFSLRSHDESLYLIANEASSVFVIWRFMKQWNRAGWEIANVIPKPPRCSSPYGFTSNGTFIMTTDIHTIFYAYVPGKECFVVFELEEPMCPKYSYKYCEHHLETETLISP